MATDPAHHSPAVPGLPSNWPELLAAALAGASDEDFEIFWRQVGTMVRFLARDARAARTAPAAETEAAGDLARAEAEGSQP